MESEERIIGYQSGKFIIEEICREDPNERSPGEEYGRIKFTPSNGESYESYFEQRIHPISYPAQLSIEKKHSMSSAT